MKAVTSDQLREMARNYSARNLSTLCRVHWRKIELWQDGHIKLLEEDLKKIAKIITIGT